MQYFHGIMNVYHLEMEKREYRNQDNLRLSEMIRQSLKELEDEEFILQIPLKKEVTEDEREIRT